MRVRSEISEAEAIRRAEEHLYLAIANYFHFAGFARLDLALQQHRAQIAKDHKRELASQGWIA